MATPIIPARAGQLNIEIERYASFDQPLHFKDKLTGDAIDLTGATFRMQIRENKKSGTVLISLTSANTRIVHTDLLNGDITLSLSAGDTGSLPGTVPITGAVYDLLADLPSAKVERLLEGQVHIHDGVTHA